MQDPRETSEHREQHNNEYQDAHFHDDEEDVPADDIQTRPGHPSAKRKPIRRMPRRRYDYDE